MPGNVREEGPGPKIRFSHRCEEVARVLGQLQSASRRRKVSFQGCGKFRSHIWRAMGTDGLSQLGQRSVDVPEVADRQAGDWVVDLKVPYSGWTHEGFSDYGDWYCQGQA